MPERHVARNYQLHTLGGGDGAPGSLGACAGPAQDSFDPGRPLARRRAFVREVVRQGLRGLAAMHARQRLHQSLGPASLLLSTTDETCGPAPANLSGTTACIARLANRTSKTA